MLYSNIKYLLCLKWNLSLVPSKAESHTVHSISLCVNQDIKPERTRLRSRVKKHARKLNFLPGENQIVHLGAQVENMSGSVFVLVLLFFRDHECALNSKHNEVYTKAVFVRHYQYWSKFNIRAYQSKKTTSIWGKAQLNLSISNRPCSTHCLRVDSL